MASTERSVPAPNGYSERIATYSSTTQVAICAPCSDEDGQPSFEMIDAPLGTHHLYLQQRRCGDWYAEFTGGKRIRCATGESNLTAIRNAAACFGVAA